MPRERIQELDKLFQEIGTYRKSNQFKELMSFIKKFPHIAPYNAMLVHVQKPGSHYVASVREWHTRFNRSIKPGARPLVILRPFGPVTFVFDLSDTEGTDPFPEALLNPFKAEGNISNATFVRIVDNIKCYGVEYYEVDHGTDSAGLIKKANVERHVLVVRNNKEIIVKAPYEIWVNGNHPVETKFSTLIHELGHLFCGHLGAPLAPKATWWNDRRYVENNACEFEAESICWLVCERMGVKNPSAEYLSAYLDYNKEIPNISIDTVLKSVGKIESMINAVIDPQKEIIIG